MKKMLGKVKGFFAMLLAVVMVLGMITVPSGMVMGAEVQEGKANEGDYEDANVVTVTWKNQNVYVHYVDEDGNSILTETIEAPNLDTAGKKVDKGYPYSYSCYDLSRLINEENSNFNAYQLKGVYTKSEESDFNEVYEKDTLENNRITSYLVYDIQYKYHDDNAEADITVNDDNIRYEAEWVDREADAIVGNSKTSEALTEYLDNGWAKRADGQDIFLVYETRVGINQTDGWLVDEKDIYDNDELGLRMYIFNYPNGTDDAQGENGKYLWGGDDKFGRNENLVPYPKYYSDYLKNADEKFDNEGFPFYYNRSIKTENGEEYKENMANWFNPDPAKNNYDVAEVDRLFQKDDQGMYYYNSAWNAAVLNRGTTDEKGRVPFKLYKNLMAPCDNYGLDSMTAGGVGNRIAGKDPYKRGNFLPYNDIDVSKVWSYVPCIPSLGEKEAYKNQPVFGLKYYEDKDGQWKPYPSNEDGVTQEADTYKYTDYHFGMYMVGTIQQPSSGLNDNELVYSISGDDDIVIYMDGIKVIDLGGIHGKVEATINFTTGKVEYDIDENSHVKNDTTYLADIMRKVAKDNNIQINEDDFDDKTFAGNTVHEMKVFYAERGYGASNLYITFSEPNLGTIPVSNQFYYKKIGTDSYDEAGAEFELDKKQYTNNVKYQLYYAEDVENGKPKEGKKPIETLEPDGTAGWTGAFTGLNTTKKYVVVARDISEESQETDPEKMFGGSESYRYDNTNVRDNNPAEEFRYSQTITFEGDNPVADEVVIRNYYSELASIPTTEPTTEPTTQLATTTTVPPTTEAATPPPVVSGQQQNTKEEPDEDDYYDDEDEDEEDDAEQKSSKNGTKTGDQMPIAQTLIFLLDALCGIALCVIIRKYDKR